MVQNSEFGTYSMVLQGTAEYCRVLQQWLGIVSGNLERENREGENENGKSEGGGGGERSVGHACVGSSLITHMYEMVVTHTRSV